MVKGRSKFRGRTTDAREGVLKARERRRQAARDAKKAEKRKSGPQHTPSGAAAENRKRIQELVHRGMSVNEAKIALGLKHAKPKKK